MIKILALDKSLNTSVEDLQVIDCVTTCLISGEKKCRRLQKDIYCIYPVFFKNIFSSLKYFFLCNNNHSMQYNALSYYSVVCFFGSESSMILFLLEIFFWSDYRLEV